jgi:hypothetical protein
VKEREQRIRLTKVRRIVDVEGETVETELKNRGITEASRADYERLSAMNFAIKQTQDRIKLQRDAIAEEDEKSAVLVSMVKGVNTSLYLLRELKHNRKELVRELATRHKLPK